MHSALYRHGFAQGRDLVTQEKRVWPPGLALPGAARAQITIALSVIDAPGLKCIPI
jgi:hypothetical protein